jgi:glucose uptake protein GlcU
MKFLLAADTFTKPPGVPGPDNFGKLVVNVTNVLLFIAGAVAVIFIIVGAIMYATSAGNEQNVAKAKSTITNAVVGLVIAILAFGIVNFVLNIF